MKNDHFINGNVTKIILKLKQNEVFECLIDTEDLEKVKSINSTWRVQRVKNSNIKYAIAVINGKTILMHRFILSAPRGFDVDHYNHNGLDNRKSNIKSVSHSLNMQNKNVNRTSKTGIRGVMWDKSAMKWVAEIKTNGKKIFKQYYDDIEEAKADITVARQYFFQNTNEEMYKNILLKSSQKKLIKQLNLKRMCRFKKDHIVPRIIKYIETKENCNELKAYEMLKQILA